MANLLILTKVINEALIGMMHAAVVQAAVKLGLPDAIGEAGATFEELRRAIDADPDSMARLLDALTTLGLLRRDEQGVYLHSECSAALRSDASGTLGDVVRMAGEDWMWQGWHTLDEVVRTGETLFQCRYGTDFFGYLEDVPEAGTSFRNAIAALSEATDAEIVGALRLTGARRVIDVGGGRGHLLRTVLERYPDTTGVLLDLATVLPFADSGLRGGPLADRCRLVAGDVRRQAAPEGDVYLLRHVLHLWDDDTCVEVLRNIAAAAWPSARVVAVEQVKGASPVPTLTALMDLQLLLTTGGRERAEEEFIELFRRAGLIHVGTIPTATVEHLIEATVRAG